MVEKNKEILDAIPKKFKEKFTQIKELGSVRIEQESIDECKKNLCKIMLVNSPEEMKLVKIKIIFLTKDGILCETGASSEGFDEEDWKE
jgi:hypothetical protein